MSDAQHIPLNHELFYCSLQGRGTSAMAGSLCARWRLQFLEKYTFYAGVHVCDMERVVCPVLHTFADISTSQQSSKNLYMFISISRYR